MKNVRQLFNSCLKVENKAERAFQGYRSEINIFACGYHKRFILTDYEIQMGHKLLIWSVMSVLLVSLDWSQGRAIRPATSKASTGARQALVISNSEYKYAGRLRNLVNDDRALGNIL